MYIAKYDMGRMREDMETEGRVRTMMTERSTDTVTPEIMTSKKSKLRGPLVPHSPQYLPILTNNAACRLQFGILGSIPTLPGFKRLAQAYQGTDISKL